MQIRSGRNVRLEVQIADCRLGTCAEHRLKIKTFFHQIGVTCHFIGYQASCNRFSAIIFHCCSRLCCSMSFYNLLSVFCDHLPNRGLFLVIFFLNIIFEKPSLSSHFVLKILVSNNNRYMYIKGDGHICPRTSQ